MHESWYIGGAEFAGPKNDGPRKKHYFENCTTMKMTDAWLKFAVGALFSMSIKFQGCD